MKILHSRCFWILLAVTATLLAAGPAAWGQPGGTPPAVRVETRAVPGRDVKQVNAQGLIEAPPHVVRAVIADLERYPAFMPYVKESRVLGRDASGDVQNYQRLSFGLPFVQDRHYMIRVIEREYRDADRRRAWVFVWRLEDGLPAGASASAVRVSVNSGHWDLRSVSNAEGATDLRYCVFTDPAGSLPKWLVGLANTEGIPQLFAAVSTAAKSSRYASLPPPLEMNPLAERPSLGECADTSAPVR
ncbi:MAG TPA: SRPBCC family protein [Candidatus Binatia bacterium]|nr:SRPBCC family protein [Candidatus Binatia bacterium]